jgi:aminoglycoside phosphotransferase (APT) family kinase protein
MQHVHEINIDSSLVRQLIANQFPQWAALPILEVSSTGTDNAIYRLGEDMVVRLPRLARAAEMVDREQRWLPRLAPLLPLITPVPLARGRPDGQYAYPWSVYRWVDGETLADQPQVDLHDVAVRLGRFVAALQRIDTTGGPPSPRAMPVSNHDDEDVRSTIRHLASKGLLDPAAATAAWEAALAAPVWERPSVWIHGDLYPANLLAAHGRLTAVIDFGLLGLGDPACDMLPAWAVLTAPTRDLFRAHAGVDDDTWLRGRGWALSAGLGAVRVYGAINPGLASAGRHAIAETIADFQRVT